LISAPVLFKVIPVVPPFKYVALLVESIFNRLLPVAFVTTNWFSLLAIGVKVVVPLKRESAEAVKSPFKTKFPVLV
jgi:hypothetical protein